MTSSPFADGPGGSDPHSGPAADAPAGASGADTSHRRSEQQKRILAAAMTCFAREGFHGTSMQKICAEAGMSPGALYRYFPSKEALIAAIVADERSQRLHILDTLARAPSLIEALMGCMRELLEEPTLPTAQLGPEIMAEAIRNAPLRAAIEACEDESRAQLRQALANAAAREEIDRAIDLDDLMIFLQMLADGAILHHQLHPEWNVPARLSALTALLRRMLAPDPGTGGVP